MTAPTVITPVEVPGAGYSRRFRILNLVDRDLAIVAYESGEWESRPAVGSVLHTDQAWDFEVGHRFGHENKADLCLEFPADAGHPRVDVEFDVDAFGTPWASASATSGISATVSGSTVIVTAGSAGSPRSDAQEWCRARCAARTSIPKSEVGSRHTEWAWLAPR